MTYQCFLIEPVLEDLDSDWASKDRELSRDWIPGKHIVGWVRKDTGETQKRNNDFGVGAMWSAVWLPKNVDWDNEAEPHLLVRCPSPDGGNTGDWDIDSRCSSCGRPEDKLHRCWVRHGTPPVITVNKAGDTCAAGAGSILLPHWHGMLENGILRPC